MKLYKNEHILILQLYIDKIDYFKKFCFNKFNNN